MYAHNIFLHMGGEVGVLGLMMFIWMLFALFKDFKDKRKLISDPFINTVHLGLVLSVIAFLINGLTETSLYYSRVAMIFWYLIGFTFGVQKLGAKN